MIDVYNALLRIAPRLDTLPFDVYDPERMPGRQEIERALSQALESGNAAGAVIADPVLRRVLMRMAIVNSIVVADTKLERWEPEALLVGVGGIDWDRPKAPLWAPANCGEMICPECGVGSLCYLIGAVSGAFVECSTVDCLYWDARH